MSPAARPGAVLPGATHHGRSRATLAETAFPVTAALLGVGLLGASLTWTQWLGMVVVVASVTALGLRERSQHPVVATAAAT